MIFNFDEELQKYNLTEETYEALLKDCSDKVQHITDVEWQDIVDKYKLGIHYDSLRKAQQLSPFAGAFISEYFKSKTSKENSTLDEDEYFKKLRIEKDEIYKAKKQLFDQRREYNKHLTVDGRSEHLFNHLIGIAENLNKEKPLFEKE